jgi:hypothetical protein
MAQPDRLHGRRQRRIIAMARLGHSPSMVASLLQLPPEAVERVVAEARERAKTSPLRAVTTERPRFRASQLAFKPRALKP